MSYIEGFVAAVPRANKEAYRQHAADALGYFRSRVPRARRDADDAVAFVVRHADTSEAQDRCVAALVRKTEILWHLLDCVAAGDTAE